MPIALPAIVRLSALSLAILVATVASAQQSFSTLEERMTGQEFRESGLYKLTDEELAALNRWIRARSLTENEALDLAASEGRASDPSADRRGFPQSGSPDEPIRSRIAGPFSGWNGDTEFVLENGMVWRQTQAGRFSIGQSENVEVTISPGILGAWYLSVDGYNRRVRVERVR